MPSDIPNGVGPHEFRELELMLAGIKPLAMFFDVIPPTIELPEAEFEPSLKSGRIVLREEVYLRPEESEPPLRYLYYALAEEEHRIERLHQLNQKLIETARQTRPEDHILTGQLLGYEEWEISVFLKWLIERSNTTDQ